MPGIEIRIMCHQFTPVHDTTKKHSSIRTTRIVALVPENNPEVISPDNQRLSWSLGASPSGIRSLGELPLLTETPLRHL